jgi:hypothetical protein
MVDSKLFNPLPLLSVKDGLDSSLAQIGSELENYFKRFGQQNSSADSA